MPDTPIRPEEAKAFTEELNELMDKYGFAFPGAQWIYNKYEGQKALFANTELLEKFPDNPKYNAYFTIHYEADSICDRITGQVIKEGG